jgi:hypothetical protein
MAFRVVLYLAFVLVAAPFEILLDLWAGLMRPDAQLRLRPIAEGLVYIYAFTLIIETWFRMQSKPAVLRRKAWLKWLQLVCILLIFVFMIDYMGELRPRLMDGERVSDSINRQLAVLTFALGCSFLSYIALEATTKKRRRQ